VLHQVGVSFDLYYDARKHKIKTMECKSAATRLHFPRRLFVAVSGLEGCDLCAGVSVLRRLEIRITLILKGSFLLRANLNTL